ncbi:MAG TPA: hypothetical protein DCP73_13255 [Chloroflexi bacterium]|nr:hypothetical protein [Chloroflexota bacterium]
MMGETDKLLMTTMWLSLGVAPLDTVHFDINKMLAGLPPDEARKMRRKFRKLWRKYTKRKMSEAKGVSHKQTAVREVGLGEQSPTRAQRNHRKRAVYWGLRKDVLEPLIKMTKP